MDTSYFSHKKCFVTGAASGIGKATAMLLAEKNTELFLTDINAEGLEKTVEEIRAKNGKVSEYLALNISDYEAVKAFAEKIQSQYGAMDIIMNIAGISIWGAVDKMKHEEWKSIIDVNLMGPIHVIETFVPEMMKQNSGHIVNVASAA